MRMRIFILLFIMHSVGATAQDMEIFGYFEPQHMIAKVHDDIFQLSSNKLRVDLQYQPSDYVKFGANFNYITYHGKTTWNIIEFLPNAVMDEIPDLNFFGIEINPYILPYEDRHFLDNAYVQLTFTYADITIGKQQLSMGTGYAWNPTDVFNQKDVLDPTYEQPGQNAIRLDFPFYNDFRFTTIYAPTDDQDNLDLLTKIKGRIGHFDISMMGIQKKWTYTDARIFDLINMAFYQLPVQRYIWGGDIVGELLGIGVWSEFAYNRVHIDDKEWDLYRTMLGYSSQEPPWSSYMSSPPATMIVDKRYYELVIGMDYTFDFQTYIMAEFYRNTSAKENYRQYRFNDWMQLLFAETKSITRDQLYLFIQHPVTDLINLGCSSIASISDGSSAIVPMLTYNIFENVDVMLYGNIYTGKEGTAYARNMGNGGIARVRVYF